MAIVNALGFVFPVSRISSRKPRAIPTRSISVNDYCELMAREGTKAGGRKSPEIAKSGPPDKFRGCYPRANIRLRN